MGNKRVILNSERLTISKPGYDVDAPNLTDEQKIFDSRWEFTDLRIANGSFVSHAQIASDSGDYDDFSFDDAGAPPVIIMTQVHGPDQGPWAPTVNFYYPKPFFPIRAGEHGSVVRSIQVRSDGFRVNWKYRNGLAVGSYKLSFIWTAYAQRLITK